MQSAAYEMMKPGVEWEDIHLQAHKVLIQGFLELGIFNSKYSAEELFAAKASARFFPTGWATFLVWIRTMWVAAPTTPTLTRYCATCELDENWNQIWSSPTSQGVTSPLLIRRGPQQPRPSQVHQQGRIGQVLVRWRCAYRRRRLDHPTGYEILQKSQKTQQKSAKS